MVAWSKWVKTRVWHLCWGCGRHIPIGAKATYNTGIDGGTFQHAYLCKDCDEYIAENANDYQDGFGFMEFLEDDDYKNKVKDKCITTI